MNAQDGEEEIRRGWLRWLGAGIALLVLFLIALWTQRAPIVENFVARELNRRGVQADYALTQVGLRTQRIEKVVLGDPADPDLTADWVEVDIAFAGVTPQLAAVRAGGVRLRASYRDGVLALGELDKFRDPESTAPFSLPDIALALSDARLRLDTDAGPVGIRLDGNGNLQSGFRGKLAAAMPQLGLAGCGLSDASAWLDIAMNAGQPHLAGPVRADALGCRDARTAIAKPVADVDVRLSKALDRWTGHIALSGEAMKSNGVVLERPNGRIDFDGTATGTSGRLRLATSSLSASGAGVGQTDVNGTWRLAGKDARLQGMVSARHLRTGAGNPLAGLRASAQGTPVGPLVARLEEAVRRAGDDNITRSRFALAMKGGAGSLVLNDTRLDARSGARVALAPDSSVLLSWPGAGGGAIGWALNGALTSEGGGLPRAALRLARRPGGGLGGQLFVDPYAAGGARLAIEPMRFVAEPGGATRFSTMLRLDGPLPDGYLRGLSVPLEGRMSADGAVAINPRCVPLTIGEARYGAFAIGATRQTVCPVPGGPLLAVGPGGVRGGAEIRKLVLAGRNGDSPMRLTADNARLALARGSFRLDNAELRLGPADSPVRLTAATLEGAAAKGGFGGTLSGGGGQIGAVPLIVEQGNGRWAFAGGRLRLDAAMTVRDSQPSVRFNPLAVPDFSLTLADGRIAAAGTLQAPRGSATVARVDIVHDLGSGRGRADLVVPALLFGPGFQPDDVTPLTRGVIANVNATIVGSGQISWTGTAVTSTGTFRTDKAKLAAAFGPVEGLSGEIRFTDMLNMVSAPAQEVRIAMVNPGVEVRDGLVRYRIEPNQKVHIEGGGWPFSGGQLVLLPAVMDFGADVDRYLTFRVIGLDAGAFIQAMELDNIAATGTFDGIMPLIFNAKGGRVAGGVLTARQQGMPPLLMPEGVLPSIPCNPTLQSGVLSYVGPVSNEQLGTMGKLAFDALKNLQYKCLTIMMDGALDGEMVTNVVFNGVNRGQISAGPAGFLGQKFTGLPFIFNVRIAAPFRGLLGTAQSFIDPTTLIQNSIGNQMQDKMRQGIAVQPAESDTVPNGEHK
ncbi:MAG: YdbH domain-containing protein [Sphingobium sp.]